MILTYRDVEILHALCRAVRLFSWEQIRTWWPSGAGRRLALRRLSVLIRYGLLRRFRVHARPGPWADRPAVAWTPGESPPDMFVVAQVLRSRWNRPPVTTTVYVATKRAAQLLGGVARGHVGTPYQASHDLGVSAVYLHYLKHRPADAAAWIGEDFSGRAKRGNKRPDAVVLDAVRRRHFAVEFGAGYPPARLFAFHRHCEQNSLAYEVW